MTLVLRRCFWMVDLGFIAVAAALCALVVAALLPHPIRIPSISFGFSSSPAVAKTALDANAASQVLGLPLGDGSVSGTAPVPGPVTSPLSVKLLGTSVSNVPELSLATLQDLAAKDTTVYAIGDLIQGASIVDIERLRVTVDNQGRREVIDLEQSVAAPVANQTPAPSAGLVPGVTAVGPGKFLVERKAIEAFIANPGTEMTKASFSPAFEGGLTRGWKLARLASDSILGKLGLAQGDVIRRINGYELTDPAKLLEAYGRLGSTSRTELEIERNGAPIRLEFRISG
ncbi:MAG TPA: type II secretion system protein GspC [Myxococcales bacterium]|jgi:general secretion pathway protein C